MSEIKWQEPPADQRGRFKWNSIADQLRSRPGQWALVRENTHASNATHIKNARLPAFSPAGSFEAVARRRRSGDLKVDIYARYVGEVSS